MRLKDKVAVVTGTGRGIGRAVALKFAAEGALLVICDTALSTVKALAEEIDPEGKRVLPVKADVARESEVEAMFSAAKTKFGRVDILVNNAGIKKDTSFSGIKTAEWDKVLDTNLKGAYYCCKAAQELMAELTYGRIVNFSAPTLSGIPTEGQVHYAAAAAAITGFTRSLAVELGKYGITVNCIVPEFIDTEMTREAARKAGMYLEDFRKLVVARIPLRRMGKPEEVAELALFLASQEAGFITGQAISIKGGP